MVGMILTRVFAYLGLGLVSFGGILVLVNEFVVMAQTQWSGLDLVAIQLLSLAGVPQVLGMIAGAYVTSLGVSALKRIRIL